MLKLKHAELKMWASLAVKSLRSRLYQIFENGTHHVNDELLLSHGM